MKINHLLRKRQQPWCRAVGPGRTSIRSSTSILNYRHAQRRGVSISFHAFRGFASRERLFPGIRPGPAPAPATVYRYIDRPGERPGRGSSSTSRCVMSPKTPKSRTVPSCLRGKQRCVWNIRCNCFTTAWILFSSAQSLVMSHAGFIIQHAFALA